MKKLLLLLLLSLNLHAETIEMVVYGGPGGPSDLASRKIAEVIGQQVIITNKTGAGHNIAYQYISQTNKPTIFISDITLIRNKDTIGYPEDITSQVKPIYYLGEFNSILFVNSNINSFEELKTKKEVRIGYGGKGTFSEEAMNDLCKQMNCLEVPYKSGALGIIDVMSGVIDAYPMVSFGAESFLQNPKLKAVKETTKKQWTMLFSRNLTDEDEKTIINRLSNQNEKFYTDLGLHYGKKNINSVWNNALKGK